RPRRGAAISPLPLIAPRRPSRRSLRSPSIFGVRPANTRGGTPSRAVNASATANAPSRGADILIDQLGGHFYWTATARKPPPGGTGARPLRARGPRPAGGPGPSAARRTAREPQGRRGSPPPPPRPTSTAPGARTSIPRGACAPRTGPAGARRGRES